jgi:predicted DNA-binding transcriptional regulator YafY
MNRIDRLLAILLKISNGRLFKAKELAEAFELSERTVYRDISALMDLGVPIQSEAGVGYILSPDYFLPQIAFTPEEARAAVLGIQMLSGQSEGNLRDSADTALQKLEGVLSKQLKRDIEERSLVIAQAKTKNPINIDETILSLSIKSALDRKVLKILYRGYDKEESEQRNVEPARVSLFPGTNIWYMVAFCRVREGWRTFRLDRIERALPTNETFPYRAPPENGGASLYDHALEVSIAIEPSQARWIRENQHWSFIRETQTEDGLLIMTYQVKDFSFLGPWVLSQAKWIRKIEPASFRQELNKELDRIRTLLT